MKIVNFDALTPEENILLNSIAAEIRHEFNDLVSLVSKGEENNIDWVVSSIPSRNKYLSPLFLRCCRLAFIKKLLTSDPDIRQIIISDKPLARLLQNYLRKHNYKIGVICSEGVFAQIKRFIQPFRNYASACFVFGLRLIGRSKASRERILKLNSIILLDTFVLKSKIGENGSIHNGEYKDRYYPGLLDALNEREKENIFYLPGPVGFRNYLEAFHLIRKSKQNFIIPDDFLKVSDYCFILGYPFRIIKTQIPETHFQGFDMKGILEQENFQNCSNLQSILGLLNYRFAYRLAEGGTKVSRLIEWYENQINDRGMIAGFRRYHPETYIVGYQGYIISKVLHIYNYPTNSEYNSHAVPHSIAVIGNGLKDDMMQFCKQMEVTTGPAFRFQKVWNKRERYPAPNYYTILIGLPIGLRESKDMLLMLERTYCLNNNNTVRFWVKPHPTYGPEQIKSLMPGKWPDFFVFKTGDFNECIEQANLFITNASSTSVESLAKGVPVIIIGNQNGITENPIPEKIPSNIWALCNNEIEIAKTIERFISLTKGDSLNMPVLSENIRKEYFEPVTRENVKRFLGLSH